jgi:hypothetical protein
VACVTNRPLSPRSRSHLLIQGQHYLFEGICRVRSITFLSLKGFCQYLPQLLTICFDVLCTKTSHLPPRLRSHLEVKKNNGVWYILCPDHNFFIDQRILKILCTNSHNDKMICHALHLCQAQNKRSLPLMSHLKVKD